MLSFYSRHTGLLEADRHPNELVAQTADLNCPSFPLFNNRFALLIHRAVYFCCQCFWKRSHLCTYAHTHTQGQQHFDSTVTHLYAFILFLPGVEMCSHSSESFHSARFMSTGQSVAFPASNHVRPPDIRSMLLLLVFLYLIYF